MKVKSRKKVKVVMLPTEKKVTNKPVKKPTPKAGGTK